MSWILPLMIFKLVPRRCFYGRRRSHVVTLREPRLQGTIRSWAWAILPLSPDFATVPIRTEFAFRSASLALRLLLQDLYARLSRGNRGFTLAPLENAGRRIYTITDR